MKKKYIVIISVVTILLIIGVIITKGNKDDDMINIEQIYDTQRIIYDMPMNVKYRMYERELVPKFELKIKPYGLPRENDVFINFVSKEGIVSFGNWFKIYDNFIMKELSRNQPLYRKYNLELYSVEVIGKIFDSYEEYSSSEEFLNVFNEEAEKLFNTQEFCNTNKYYNSSYARNNYFSHCFAFYFTNYESKEFLKENAPKTYEYIDKIVKIDSYEKYYSSEEFLNIYNEESKKMYNSYGFCNHSYSSVVGKYNDYFSHCFQLYFSDYESKEFLKENAPKTYAYIDKVTKETEGVCNNANA